jgi:hypothetical protein
MLLTMLVHALDVTRTEFPLTDQARVIIANMLAAILSGVPAGKATFTAIPDGNRRWRNQRRDVAILIAMRDLIRDGMGPWQAAGNVASQFSLSQKTVSNLWNRLKSDRQAWTVFGPGPTMTITVPDP